MFQSQINIISNWTNKHQFVKVDKSFYAGNRAIEAPFNNIDGSIFSTCLWQRPLFDSKVSQIKNNFLKEINFSDQPGNANILILPIQSVFIEQESYSQIPQNICIKHQCPNGACFLYWGRNITMGRNFFKSFANSFWKNLSSRISWIVRSSSSLSTSSKKPSSMGSSSLRLRVSSYCLRDFQEAQVGTQFMKPGTNIFARGNVMPCVQARGFFPFHALRGKSLKASLPSREATWYDYLFFIALQVFYNFRNTCLDRQLTLIRYVPRISLIAEIYIKISTVKKKMIGCLKMPAQAFASATTQMQMMKHWSPLQPAETASCLHASQRSLPAMFSTPQFARHSGYRRGATFYDLSGGNSHGCFSSLLERVLVKLKMSGRPPWRVGRLQLCFKIYVLVYSPCLVIYLSLGGQRLYSLF